MKIRGFDYQSYQRLNADSRMVVGHKLAKLRRELRRSQRERFKKLS